MKPLLAMTVFCGVLASLFISDFGVSSEWSGRCGSSGCSHNREMNLTATIEDLKERVQYLETKFNSYAAGAGEQRTQPETQNLQGQKELLNFFSHIPKTGTTHASFAINKLLMTSPEWSNLKEQKEQFRTCYEGTVHPRRFQQKYHESYKGDKCTMWTSEHPITDLAQRNYAIVRPPQTHVISQFHHCKESRDHQRERRFIENVTLTEWLSAWINVLEHPDNTTLKAIADGFHCYNPINMQSRYVKFENSSKWIERLTVLGDQAQMDLSTCLIAIRYAEFVPALCRCDAAGEGRRSLLFDDHGVIHHGDTFQPSQVQVDMIRTLTKLDQSVYEQAKTALRQQRQDVEREYQVKVCDRLPT